MAQNERKVRQYSSELPKMVSSKLSEPQEEDQSRTNTNVGNQVRLDKDYYENSHEKDSAGPWEQRPRK